jgi:siroheme decarboxylase
MNDLDKQLLTAIQTALPIEARPFDALAARLGITPDDCLARLKSLVADGAVRRIGPVFDSRQLGYASTLVAARVSPEQLEATAARVSCLPGVTHNYERRHAYNLWFTLTAPSAAALEQTLRDLADETGAEFHSLPALAIYKIRVQFDLTEDDELSPSSQPSPTLGRGSPQSPAPLGVANDPRGGSPTCHGECAPEARGRTEFRRAGPGEIAPLSEDQKRLVRLIQDGLAVETEPFAAAARELGWTVERVVEQIRQWTDAGVIRRFGAVVRHHQLGFTANGMSVFRLTPDRVDEAGRRLAQRSEVSHCYRRPPLPDFAYNLFAMTHGRTEDEVRVAAVAMAREVSPEAHDVLFSVREFKKVSMRYFFE